MKRVRVKSSGRTGTVADEMSGYVMVLLDPMPSGAGSHASGYLPQGGEA